MAKEINFRGMSAQDIDRAMQAADLLTPAQHRPGCPVRAGASTSCVLPFACCVFEEFENLDPLTQPEPEKTTWDGNLMASGDRGPE